MDVADPLIQASLLGEAIDGGPVGVLVADDRMRYVAANGYACELLGYERDELLRLLVTDVARYDSAADDYRRMMRERGHAGEATLTRKDGSQLRVHVRAREARIARMPVYVAVLWPAEDEAA